MGAINHIICLGIESTADNLGIGIANSEGIILANEVSVHIPKEGGIHPREAARHHAAEIGGVLTKAMDTAGIGSGDID